MGFWGLREDLLLLGVWILSGDEQEVGYVRLLPKVVELT